MSGAGDGGALHERREELAEAHVDVEAWGIMYIIYNAYIHIYTYICVSLSLYIYIYTHIDVHVCICLYICIIYIYICIGIISYQIRKTSTANRPEHVEIPAREIPCRGRRAPAPAA